MKDSSDSDGEYLQASLDTYFDVRVGKKIDVTSLPSMELFDTYHVKNLENYGVRIGSEVFYSGDTIELPSYRENLIFQDCQFYEGKSDVHISYDWLNKDLPDHIKSKTHLVHLGGGWDKINPQDDGFAGFVKPGDVFEI